MPLMSGPDLGPGFRGHRWRRLPLRHGSVAEILLESGLWENKYDRQRRRPRIFESDSDVSRDVNGSALADNSRLLPERHFCRSLLDEDDLVGVKMPMGWDGLPGLEVLHPHHHVHRPAVLLVHFQYEGKVAGPPGSSLTFVGLKDQPRRRTLRGCERTSQNEGESRKTNETGCAWSHGSPPVKGAGLDEHRGAPPLRSVVSEALSSSIARRQPRQ